VNRKKRLKNMKKVIAGFMTALLAIIPFVSAVELGNYPTFLAEDGELDALVVIGAAADVGDVVGAVDVAARLAETGATEVETACEGASGAVTGTEKDSVALSGDLSAVFPASGVLKTAHYSQLQDSLISWRGTDYDYREQVDISGVAMSHDLATSNVNGTEKMLVESGDIKYQFVFDKQLNISSASGAGTISSPEYSYPVNLEMMGTDFSLVGAGSNQVKMLHGSIGTATATTPVEYGDYSVYSDLGSDASWARVIMKDADGNTVDTLTINQGSSKQSAATGLTVQVTAVRALQDGTVVGADVVVGPTSEGVSKTYDVTADVTSSGTASDRFPGETDWGIQVSSGSFGSSGLISAGDTLEVVYKPTTTQYLVAGEMISLPNDYGDLAFEGWNTDKFATITITPLSGTVAAYNVSADTQAFGNLGGIEIASDVSGSIVSGANTGYNKGYLLFNYSRTGEQVPIFVGFYDSSKQKILVNGTIVGANEDCPTSEFVSKIVDFAATYTGTANATVTYAFKLSYGNAADKSFYLNMTASGGDLISASYAGASATDNSIVFELKNKSAVTTSQAPEFKLGATAASTEADEINATTHSSKRNAGKKTQEIVDDTGIILLNTDSYGASDKVAFKVPFKDLKAVVYFGKKGEGVSGDTITYTSYPSVPISSALAKLDTELTDADKASNLIAVGGPAVNRVSADALELTYPTYGQDAADALGITEGEGAIMAVDSPYATGKVVLVVAGWDVTATRAASTALQQFDTQLEGITDASFVV
jgi:hypothetical protein